MSGIGMPGIILIVLVALLLFGPRKLPELGRAFGKTLREFKNGAREMMDDEEQPARKEVSRSDSSTISSGQTNEVQNNDRRLPD